MAFPSGKDYVKYRNRFEAEIARLVTEDARLHDAVHRSSGITPVTAYDELALLHTQPVDHLTTPDARTIARIAQAQHSFIAHLNSIRLPFDPRAIVCLTNEGDDHAGRILEEFVQQELLPAGSRIIGNRKRADILAVIRHAGGQRDARIRDQQGNEFILPDVPPSIPWVAAWDALRERNIPVTLTDANDPSRGFELNTLLLDAIGSKQRARYERCLYDYICDLASTITSPILPDWIRIMDTIQRPARGVIITSQSKWAAYRALPAETRTFDRFDYCVIAPRHVQNWMRDWNEETAGE